MKQRTLPLLTTISLLSCSMMVNAQSSTKDGTSLEWRHELKVVQGTITVNKVEYPAHTITLFEADANKALELWKADHTPISASIGSRPLKASGARIPQLAEDPIVVLAEASTEKKAGLAKLTLAFLRNDSTSLEDNGEQEKLMHALAVRLNKAVVQGQIDRYQRDLDKTSDKLGSTEDDVAKARKNLTKANSDLEKVKAKRGKIEADNAKVHGNISGLERKFALSNDPKDLQKLTKARQKLAKNEGTQAKLMQQEAKVQGNINKHQGTLDAHSKKAAGQAESKEDLQRIIAELKRKQDSIR